jgi:hypothetical protein
MDNELESHLYEKFDELIDALYDSPALWTNEMTEAENMDAYERVHERIQVEVNKNPILSRTVSKSLLHWSLLATCSL